MSDVVPDQPVPPASAERVGDRLRAGREAAGLSIAEVGQRTRVPLRHLEAIEATDFAALPSPTYAVGFARAYARTLGMDEVAVAHDVRLELRNVTRAPEYAPYETADPARVPSRGVAIVGLGLALAVIILVGLWYGTDVLRREGTGTMAATPATSPSAAPTPTAAPAPAAPRQVTLAAGDDEVWLRVYDAANTTLYLGILKPGEKFDVPPTANGPMINVGRPDELQVSVDGRAIPPLGDGRRPIKDVPVDAASIAARLSGAPVATAPPPTPSAISAATPSTSPARTTAARPRPRPTRVLTETQRANLNSAANPPASRPNTSE
jgi:transcriptional regulator with XRE-family HTH domain